MRLGIGNLSGEAATLLSLGIILLAGFLSTRVTKKLRLPQVSGYILTGIVIGPHLTGIIPAAVVDKMGFVSDLALAFIAFGVGRFFKKETLRQTGRAVLLITCLEALLAGIFVFCALYFALGVEWDLALLLGAIATATAPASTVMTIHQYHAKGRFVDLLLQIVALDDVVCLLVFSGVSAVVTAAGEGGAISFAGVALPILYNIGAIALGAAFAVLLWKILPPSRSRDNRLILALALLLCLTGICAIFSVSPLLSCMVFGAVYINRTQDERLFEQISAFTPPVMSLFFVVSGMRLDLSILPAFGLVGVVYFLVRIAGKYAGAYLGCRMTGQDEKTCRWLGGALVPQAGVAIGLASLAARMLPEQIGNLLLTIILASSVLYELAGPVCAKISLVRSGAIPPEEKQDAPHAAQHCASH